MNSKERFLAALKMDVPDRVPAFYQQLGGAKHVLQAAGLTMREGFHDPEVFARIMMKARELFAYDNVMIGWGDLLTEAQALGSTWKFPERDFYPRVDQYAGGEPADVDRLVPVDPMSDRFWSVPLKAGAILQERIGREVAVIGSVISPFFVASELRGYENLMMDTFNDPGMVHRMVQVALESEMMYGERIAALGLEATFLDGSGASGQMVSPEMCAEYDIAYLRRLLERYRTLGIRTIVHNDSELPYLGLQIEAGAAAVHFNNDLVDLPELIQKNRGKICLVSGINHQVVIFQRTAAEVEAKVREAIELYGKDPGLMIAPGSEIPFKSPLENILMVREACERYGRY
jgi:uroporphyrinogen decarboxylase